MPLGEVINAIYNDKQTEHYVNIPHHGHVENIPADWAVEAELPFWTQWRDAAAYHRFRVKSAGAYPHY